MGWFRKKNAAEASGTRPPRRRWRLRLIYLLALPVAVSVAHLSMVAWRGEPFLLHDCRLCGAHYRITEQRLFGYWWITTTMRVQDTPCSRLLREHCGWQCPRHDWVRDPDSPGGARFGFVGLSWLDASPEDTLRGLVRPFLTDTTPEMWRTLGVAAERSPEEVRDLVRFMLLPRDFGPMWRAIHEAMAHAVDQRGSNEERLELRQLLPASLDAATWAAIRALVASPAPTTSTGSVAPDREIAFPIMAWVAAHGADNEKSWALSELPRQCGSGSDVVGFLVRSLEDPQGDWSSALDGLQLVGVNIEGVEEALGRALDRGDPALRLEIAGRIAARAFLPRNPAVVQALVRALDGGDEILAQACVQAIAQLGEPALEALQAMLPQVPGDRRLWYLRAVAGWPFLRVRSVRRFILACVGAPDVSTRRLACSMLPKLGPYDAEIKACVDNALVDTDREVRDLAQAAAKILAAPDRPQTAAEWIQAYEDDSESAPEEESDSEERLGHIESEWRSHPGRLPESAVRELASLIDDPWADVARAALELVAQIGADAGDVKESVRARLEDPAHEVRDAAAVAWKAIGPGR